MLNAVTVLTSVPHRLRTVISIPYWKRKSWGFCLSLSVSSDHDFKLIWAMISSPNKLLLFQWRAEAVLKCFFCSFGQHNANMKWFENREKKDSSHKLSKIMGLGLFWKQYSSPCNYPEVLYIEIKPISSLDL